MVGILYSSRLDGESLSLFCSSIYDIDDRRPLNSQIHNSKHHKGHKPILLYYYIATTHPHPTSSNNIMGGGPSKQERQLIQDMDDLGRQGQAVTLNMLDQCNTRGEGAGGRIFYEI